VIQEKSDYRPLEPFHKYCKAVGNLHGVANPALRSQMNSRGQPPIGPEFTIYPTLFAKLL
jgi:hypothetical protein